MVKVLVTDDSVFQRKIITSVLAKENIEYVEAGNGKEALDKLKTYTPDLILLDLLMPEMDGFHLLKNLRSKNNNVPVIVLSSDIQESTKNICVELGVTSFVNKPVDASVLLTTIYSVLEIR